MAASETWSVASSSIIDTQSEPAIYFGKKSGNNDDPLELSGSSRKSNNKQRSASPGSKSSGGSGENKAPQSALEAKLNAKNSKVLASASHQPSHHRGSSSSGASKSSQQSQKSSKSSASKNTKSSSTSKKKSSPPSPALSPVAGSNATSASGGNSSKSSGGSGSGTSRSRSPSTATKDGAQPPAAAASEDNNTNNRRKSDLSANRSTSSHGAGGPPTMSPSDLSSNGAPTMSPSDSSGAGGGPSTLSPTTTGTVGSSRTPTSSLAGSSVMKENSSHNGASATTTPITNYNSEHAVPHSRDPESSLSTYGQSTNLHHNYRSTAANNNHNSTAIVPVTRERDEDGSTLQSSLDPPDSSESEFTGGSSTNRGGGGRRSDESTMNECPGATAYDPPEETSIMSQSQGYSSRSTSAASSSRRTGSTTTSTTTSYTRTSSSQSRTTAISSQSYSTYGSGKSSSRSSARGGKNRGGNRRSSQGNNNEQLAVWNEVCEEDSESGYVAREDRQSTIASSAGSQDSASYYSDENSGSGGERALAIREEDSNYSGSSDYSGEEDEFTDAKDARALVAREDYGGVNSVTEEDNQQQQLVAREEGNHYLAKAVDNYNAIVPIDSTIYEAYDHTFVTCPEHLRFRFLYTFLKKNLDKKVMIFFSTTNSAKYHAKLLEHFHIPVLTMHGKQPREKFISRFFKFSDLDEGILCATDAAGRDLDIPPSVDWVVQFEPPDDPSEYILRVARISCDSDRVGRSLLFLNPGEHGFLKYYHSASIPVSEFEIPRHLADVQGNIEYHVNESERLLRLARDAYGSYLIAYASHGFRDVYNVHDLNKSDVATAFGLVGGASPDGTDTITCETDTLASFSYVGAAELGGDMGGAKRSSSSNKKDKSGGGGGTWEKKEKTKSKTWMKGEKSWPHSQIKIHPKFKAQHGAP